ncbi:MAG: branched-chain amino acid ABC transporter permease [Spirochaetes bacterium]|nr:branched-chain amino acid ABC transporter permease [Spirochaetota bacterium]
MKDHFKEIAILLILLIPLFFIPIGGYFQEVTGYVYLFIMQGYVAWFLYFRSGQPFFGYTVTMGAGAYGTIVLNVKFHMPLWFSMLSGSLLAAFVAVLIFVATSRARGFYVSMASFLLAILFPQLMLALQKITGGHSGLYFGGLSDYIGVNGLYITVILSGCAIAGTIFLIMSTRVGSILTLISQNDQLTKSVGINTFIYKMMAYAIAGFLSGIAGGLYVNYTGFISAVDIEVFTTVFIFFIPLLGGKSRSYGPLVGAIIVILAPELFFELELYMRILLGSLFIIVIILLPEGVGPTVERLIRGLFKEKLFKSVAR